MNKVLIADDNAQITKVLKDYAGKEGWGSYIAYDGDEALRLFREFSREISIVFLDVMMPKKDGFSVCKAIRATSQVPVIMITARSEDADKIMGLDIGADDYIVKPFSAAEVMARARAILRRIPKQEESKSRRLTIANLTIDIDNYMVTIDDNEVPLTKREKNCSGCWRPIRKRSFPGTTCWTASGATIISETAVPWIPISNGCGPNWTPSNIPAGT